MVGREGEDLSRHDKWLCMMYPRLKLLQKLLADNGAIFISIDDTEISNLRLVCDEIFGPNCLVSNVSWQRTYSTRNDSKGIVNEVEHILVYSKQPNWNPNKLPRTEAMDARYSSPDNDPRPWKAGDASAPGAATHTGMVYAIQHPISGKLLYPPNGRHWTYGQEQMLSIISEWAEYELRTLEDYDKRRTICGVAQVPETISAIVLAKPFYEVCAQSKKRYSDGTWPVLYFTNHGNGGIACKRYLEEMGGKLVTNLWPYAEVGHTDEAAKELKAIFTGVSAFDTPKPSRLIERILQIAGDTETLILDSFAGSGTTAHAVLNMNKADGGRRRFILVEMMDYADSITAERVKRVIRGYGEGNSAVPGTGGDFSFYDLGEVLLLPDGNLNESIGIERIREYVWYTETQEAVQPAENPDNPYYLGTTKDTAYYFYYEREAATTLDYDFLATVKNTAGGYTIYADLCTLSDAELKKHNIVFKKIPRDITKL